MTATTRTAFDSDTRIQNPWTKLYILLTIAIALTVYSIGAGAIRVPVWETVRTVFGMGTGEFDYIIQQYRMPRIAMAWIVGAGFAVSGTMIQGVIRNPLASPEIIGITAGAGLASAVLLLGMPEVSVQLLPFVSFLGGLIAAALVYVLAFKRGISPTRLALVGIAVSAVFTSGIDYLMTSFPIQLDMALIWLAGSLWARSWEQFIAIAPWIFIMFTGCLMMAHKLDVLALGDEQAIGLGVRVEPTRLLALAMAVALAGASVAVCGTIGFVGLMAPHMARRLVGGQHHILLPTAALVGTLLVLTADTLGRIISPPVEIPAGVITSIVGGPYFIYLLYRHRGW